MIDQGQSLIFKGTMWNKFDGSSHIKFIEGREQMEPITKELLRTIKQKQYIDLFAGCGGLSLGLGFADWNGLFAIEKDKMAFSTFYHNLIDSSSIYHHFDNWPWWLTQEPHTVEDLLDNSDIVKQLEQLRGRVALIAGGPPCQGFSVAGARNGNDPRNLLVFKQIQIVNTIRPPFVIIENVAGFARKFISRPADGMTVSVADAAKAELENIGYDVCNIKINAAEYGVPQLRERIILFGVLKELVVDMDLEQSIRNHLLEIGREQRENLGLPTDRYVNVGEAIGDLSGDKVTQDVEFPNFKTVYYLPPSSNYQLLMRKNCLQKEIPSCHRFNKHSDKVISLYKKALETQPPGRLSKEFLYENGCHSNKRFVLDTAEPCSTLTTAPEELIHFKHPRVVTLREMARLQSFPDDFDFYGRYTLNGPARGVDVPRNAQIGNAIPPLVGEALGKMIDNIASDIVNAQVLQ